MGYLVALTGDGGQPRAKDCGCKVDLLTDPLRQRTNLGQMLGLDWSGHTQKCTASMWMIAWGTEACL